MKPRTRAEKISLSCSIGMHVVLALLIIFSVEKTIVIPADPSDEKKQIIDAFMVNKKTVQEEVARLEEKELKKRQIEQEKVQELANKEKAAQEALIKEAEHQKLAQEKEKKEKEEKEKVEKEKVEKEHQAKLKKEQEELKKAQEKKAEEERVAAQLQKEKELAEQKAAQSISPRVRMDQITRYAMLMRNKIHQHWRQPIGFDFDGFTCKVAVKLLPTGEVVEAVVIESSGNLEFDRSTEVAIQKASPLPMPEDPNIAKEFHQFTFTFHPEAV